VSVVGSGTCFLLGQPPKACIRLRHSEKKKEKKKKERQQDSSQPTTGVQIPKGPSLFFFFWLHEQASHRATKQCQLTIGVFQVGRPSHHCRETCLSKTNIIQAEVPVHLEHGRRRYDKPWTWQLTLAISACCLSVRLAKQEKKKKKKKTETRAELFFPELNGVVHLPKHVIKQITVIVTTTNPRR
jgi:hypothetical protein